MKKFDKYYELLESKSIDEMNEMEINDLEKELGNLAEFVTLEDQIKSSIQGSIETPSDRVKKNLDSTFDKHFTRKPKQNGIVSIKAFEKSSPWKVFATAASMTIVLFLSVQMGFNGSGSDISSPYLADSISSFPIDSGVVQVDSILLID